MLEMTDPRRRNRLVLIEKLTRTKAANGEPVEQWDPAWKNGDAPIYLPAERLAGRALERFVIQQRLATAGEVFVLAWAPANQIDPATYRLTHEGAVMNILGAVEIGFRAAVALTCEGIAHNPAGKAGPN